MGICRVDLTRKTERSGVGSHMHAWGFASLGTEGPFSKWNFQDGVSYQLINDR